MTNHGLKKTKTYFKFGFTIIELLVVIVVIGILTAITIISYSSITEKTVIENMKADLGGASTQLMRYYADNGDYPISVTDCPNTNSDMICAKISDGNTYSYFSDGQTYDLCATNTNQKIYCITNISSTPVLTTSTPITSITAITGTAQVSSTLTAGAITPSGATVSYQWQRADTSGGAYANISGATSNTYTLQLDDETKFIKVVASGIGIYSGTQISLPRGAVAADPNWITIGTQTWARTNLNAGTMVTGVTDQTNNSVIEKYCYNNLESNCTTYGAFYQWNELMQYSTTEGAQGICPDGSHIPSDNDWKILERALGMTLSESNSTGMRGTGVGTKLKSGGSSGMNFPLVGIRYVLGSFALTGERTALWTSSLSGSDVWIRELLSTDTRVYRRTDLKTWGLSVRCVKN